MPILTTDQTTILKQRAESTNDWRDEDDLDRRRRVGSELRRVLESTGVLEGKTLDHKQLCELVGLIWQIENLNPMQMPALLGLFHYRVHFGGYTGSEEDLAAERLEETGEAVYYPGADLGVVSQALRLIASDSPDDHGQGISQMLELEGAGQALVTGFLHLLHPEQYGIVNTPIRKPFIKNGLLKVTRQQRGNAADRAKEWFSDEAVASPKSIRFVFRWEAFLREVRELCGMEDYHEADQFLWTLSEGPDKEEIEERMAAAVEAINPDDLKTRIKAEAAARELIQSKLGRLTGQDLKRLCELINTCMGKKDVVINRFGPAFVGHNQNQLIQQLDELNASIAALWNASEEEVPKLLTGFWERDLSGAGRAFPTAILYLKDKQKYAVWTRQLEKALWSVIPGLPSRFRTGFCYLQYCTGVQRLRQKLGFPPEEHDFVLFKLMTKPTPPPPPPGGAFTGFSDDAFGFLKELAENNNKTWFEQNKNRFKKSLDKPLRALVKDIGENTITPLAPNLETSPTVGKCMARLHKNIWGKAEEDAYNEYLWAAFIRQGIKKQNDCQLFITVMPNSLSYGLYIPPGAAELQERLVQTLDKHPDLGRRVFEHVLKDGFAIGGETIHHDTPQNEAPDYDCFVDLAKGQRIHAIKTLTPGEAVEVGDSLVTTIGEGLGGLYPLFVLITSEQPLTDVPPLLGDGPPDPDPEITIADLSEKTLLEETFFEKLDQYLQDKRQLIFTGPPGTSKTFVALEYAEYLAQGGGEVRTVQFHPSYGYEDFIEGLRPVASGNGSFTYRVEDGIFKRLCNAARTSPKQKFVLIIDEINRGNIPRIFGELLFLLERRDKKVDLPYSKESFSVPKNVVVLGTMNSSDRSIALMDLALRRRFHFVKMEPRADILKSWLKSNNKPESICQLFSQLNDQLRKAGVETDRHVGHAHFMSQHVDDDFLEVIWAGTIEPLLEEYFVAAPQRLDEFRLELLKEAIEAVSDEDAEEMEDEEEADNDDPGIEEDEDVG